MVDFFAWFVLILLGFWVFAIAFMIIAGVTWILWQIKYVIILALIVATALFIFNKYSGNFIEKGEECYTTMNVNHVKHYLVKV